ncbi:uncharacterized protein N7483_005613 [Penicillium malachiteum]|uniref:uncharacterized protein n=1 Tax=Penicillium malachiteum TaxID=1324776 RepID=UPI002546A994|nr:uncharacterized protein N7483_005613 [Penicillium malachiteum]KAJ5731105.1 hypothetical protein N7483_005613 [Penicillium malachiteum]
MGRCSWHHLQGYNQLLIPGLFEGDQVVDIARDLEHKLGLSGDDWKWKLTTTIINCDILNPGMSQVNFQNRDFTDILNDDMIPYLCKKLNKDNCGFDLFAKCRSLDEDFLQGKYPIIIFGAMMMRVGANIKQEDLQYLREVALATHSSPGYACPFADQGFRDPGRAQFLAALDHYQADVPRSFEQPSCFLCGQIQSDVGRVLQKCSRCKAAYYCGVVRIFSIVDISEI